MSLKVPYSLWKRVYKKEEKIEHLFHDSSLYGRGRPVEDWVDALAGHQDGRVHTNCWVTTIKFFAAGPKHDQYLQFTVKMDGRKHQEATFETRRYKEIRASAHNPVPVDIVRAISATHGEAYGEDFELGEQFRLVSFAFLLKAVSMYTDYRRSSNKCFWYAYTVYVLAECYTNNTAALPPNLLVSAENNLVSDSGLGLPNNAGKFRFIPISTGNSPVPVWEIFQDSVRVYSETNDYIQSWNEGQQMEANCLYTTRDAKGRLILFR